MPKTSSHMIRSHTILGIFVFVLLSNLPLGLLGLVKIGRTVFHRHNYQRHLESARITIPGEGLFNEPNWFRRELTSDLNSAKVSVDEKYLNSSEKLLPLFPFDYGLCYPTGDMPLNIFVMKYRMLANDIQKTDRMFGIVMSDGNGGLCEVGTCVENIKQDLQPDGRQLLYNACRQRFKILEIVQEEPYLVAKVQYPFEDVDILETIKTNKELSEDILFLEKNAYQLITDVVALANKLVISQSQNYTVEISDDVKMLSPLQSPSRLTCASDFSFALCNMLSGSTEPLIEQLLLESETLELRLRRLCDILSETRAEMMTRVEIADEPFN